jgi:hypothetical protein
MWNEFNKAARPSKEEPEETADSRALTVPDVPPQERWLLRLLLEDDEQFEWAAARLEPEWVENPVVREIVAQRLHSLDSWPGLAAWLSQLEKPEWVNLITDVLADPKPVPVEVNLKGTAQRDGAIKVLRDRYIARELAAISQRLAAPDLPEAENRELLERQSHLRRLKKEPLAARSDQA